MRVAKLNNAHKLVCALVIVAVITVAAGMRHQAQQDAAVEWHDVSLALMEVEEAKRDLHQSMQQRIGTEKRKQ